jgi:predicted metalloprotease with PDZ domain
MKRLILLACLITITTSFAQTVNYNLRMTRPQSHYFEVEMELGDFRESEISVKMPVWAPGSYLVREFARHVNQVRAIDGDGNALKVSKVTKNEWKIAKGKAKKVKVKYEVYAFELSVRTSFLDMTHGFVSGSSVFMYVDKHKERSGTLTVYPHETFEKVTTPLERSAEGTGGDANVQRFNFPDYDVLVDSPLEIGNHELFKFNAAGVEHEVAMYGLGNYNVQDLQKDMANIVEAATDVFRQNPNKHYTFIVHNVINGQGGLEHRNSCVLSVNRWTYAPGEYNNFLSLVAHEYFHLWNVKRIRPIELGPFNYDEENYTTLLWVMEGFTSYYDELLMVRAGYYSKDEYLKKLQGTINYVEGTPGSRVQSVAHSSFDAWIKGYRPNENSTNTGMTYYSRGAMLASLIDAMIVDKSNAKQSLDDFMQKLYKDYYAGKNRGFTEAEFQSSLESFLGRDLDAFFDDYVYGTKIPDYNTIYSPVGVRAIYTGKATPSFGASLSTEGGKIIVKYVRSGSTAEESGLSVGDEIIAINNLRTDQQTFENFIGSLATGEYIEILVAREELVMTLQAKMNEYEKPSFRLEQISPSNEKFYYWLRSLK